MSVVREARGRILSAILLLVGWMLAGIIGNAAWDAFQDLRSGLRGAPAALADAIARAVEFMPAQWWLVVFGLALAFAWYLYWWHLEPSGRAAREGPDDKEAIAPATQRPPPIEEDSSNDQLAPRRDAPSRPEWHGPPIPRTIRPPHMDQSYPGEPTVAVHYVGDGSEYITGLPADPTVTTFVTPERAGELVGSSRPLYAYGEAPEVPDEVRRGLYHARQQLDQLLTGADEVSVALANLHGPELDTNRVPYWRHRVQVWEDQVEALAGTLSRHRLALSERSDWLPDGESDWRRALQEHIAGRAHQLRTIRGDLRPGDLGFRPRRADPTTSFSYTSARWGNSVTLTADADGRLWPRTREEVQALDSAGFAEYADEP